MNVVILTEAFGVPTTLASTSFISNIADGLFENGHRVKVAVTSIEAGLCDTDSIPGVDAVYLFANGGAPGPCDVVSATRLGIGVDPQYSFSNHGWFAELLLSNMLKDLIHENDAPGLVMCYQRDASILEMATRVAGRFGWSLGVFATEELTARQIDPAIRERYVELVKERTDFLWATSDCLRVYWENLGYESKRIFMNYSIVKSSYFGLRRTEQSDADGVFTGNLGSRYIGELLRVVEIVKRKKPDVVVEAYGDARASDTAGLMDEIEHKGLQKNVILKRGVSPAKIPEILARGRLLLAPVSEENRIGHMAPHKIAEYFATGGLVVATNVGDLREMFENRKDCFLAENTEEFADMVIEALNLSDIDRRAMGERGRKQAECYVNATVVTRRMIDFQHSVNMKPRDYSYSKISIGSFFLWYKGYRQYIGKPYVGPLEKFKRLVVMVLRKVGLKQQENSNEDDHD